MAHIVIVEPDTQLARLTCQLLQQAGHTVVTAAAAQQAVFAIDEKQPDLVVLELQLVGHSGIEFLYEMQSYPEWQHIPVVLHTLVPPTEFAASGTLLRQQLGVKQYLYKPHTRLADLLRAVTEFTSAPAAATA